ncbi:TSUP family transporter [Halovenus salina]|uniref:Probable membrane transporter protein n=1 Tax=Halovenus salina TaxID=1510225 RepID=A0ABD5W3F6_9EURY
MTLTLTPLFLLGVGVLFLVAGAVNGLAGFGFALVGTMTLATVVVPATAVVFMIVPILGVNISLVGELSAGEIRSCGRRFAPLLVSTLLGTVAGMAAIDALPESPLRLLLGIVSLGFVVSAQPLVSVPGLDRAREGCFVETTPAMVGVGGLSGLVFGGRTSACSWLRSFGAVTSHTGCSSASSRWFFSVSTPLASLRRASSGSILTRLSLLSLLGPSCRQSLASRLDGDSVPVSANGSARVSSSDC